MKEYGSFVMELGYNNYISVTKVLTDQINQAIKLEKIAGSDFKVSINVENCIRIVDTDLLKEPILHEVTEGFWKLTILEGDDDDD